MRRIAITLAALGTLVLVGQSLAAGGALVKTRSTSLGRVLVDAHGRTLYMFTADKHGRSACYGQCATFWPPLFAQKGVMVHGVGIEAKLLGTTRRRDGRLQVTYAKHPLYLFLKDKKAGQVTGQGINHFGGLWWVLAPSGRVVRKTAASSPPPTTTTTTTTTGGYGGPGGGYGP